MSQINSLIKDFSTTNLIAFLRSTIPSFKPNNKELDHLFTEDIYEKYESIIKIGEAEIDKDDLIVIASKTNDPLTERTGKKNQYEIAKTILKHEVKDASLFIFYDDEGNFRFSFVKANYLGTKRDFTDFKRYTYFVTPSQTNKTFKKQVGGCNFNSLDEIIQAFSVEPLNKQFYQDIAKAFYELIGGKYKQGHKTISIDNPKLQLPGNNERKAEQEFGVRLIGRTIFCWFLKNKKSTQGLSLIPENWLSSKAVKSDYYHSSLEKLFFLVLNTKISDRKESFLLPDNHIEIPFLNGGLFEPQIEDYFKNNKANYALKIPDKWFKNLFETLEQYNFTIDENSIYDAEVSIDPEMLGTIFENLLAEIDPDTEKSARKATGSFYTPREIVDYMVEQSLVQYLKTKLKTPSNSSPFRGGAGDGGVQDKTLNAVGRGVKNLNNLPHLKTFRKQLRNNLTPAEAKLWTLLKGKQLEGHKFRRQFSVANYILDFYCHEEKLAIELDGQGHFEASQAEYDRERDLFLEYYGIKVLRFENKWVWDNPDGLIAKVKSNFGWSKTPQSLRTAPLTGEQLFEEQLLALFKEGGENKFKPTETKKILEALSDIKILDPACGSGAFPMGALHKIINALHKLDPDASWWKQKQIANVPNALAKKMLKEKLDGESADYVRKLGVIQNSIYGVDIQPIASEISKLRSFLSLVIDETIIDGAENRGIQALPNLEFKFVTANTLIGLEEKSSSKEGEKYSGFLDFGQTDDLQDQLKTIRNQYLQAYGAEKVKLKKAFEQVQTKILKQELAGGGQNKRALQLASWKPFSNESNAWFDPYWMYGVDKFDIVIGNPPYVFTRDVDFGLYFKDYINRVYFSTISLPDRSKARQSGKINLFAVFLLKGKQLITNEGSLIYIIPNNILRGTVYDVIRYELLMNNDIKSIVDLGAGVFSKVTASTILLQIGTKSDVSPKTNVLTDVISLAETKYKQKEIQQDIFIENTSYTFNIMLNATQLQLSNKIKRGKKNLGSFCVDIIEGIVAHKYLILANKGENCFDLIEGKDIKRFAIRDCSNFIVWNKDEIHRTRPDYLWEESKKIVMQRISGGTMPLVAGIDKKRRKTFASTNSIVLIDDYKDYYEFFTCLLNSKLLNWYYANNFSNNSNLTVNISKTFLETLPIKMIDESKLQLFKNLHHKLEDTNGTPCFELNYSLLNKIFYKIYDLNYQEVKIIDPKLTLTQKEYDNYKIDE